MKLSSTLDSSYELRCCHTVGYAVKDVMFAETVVYYHSIVKDIVDNYSSASVRIFLVAATEQSMFAVVSYLHLVILLGHVIFSRRQCGKDHRLLSAILRRSNRPLTCVFSILYLFERRKRKKNSRRVVFHVENDDVQRDRLQYDRLRSMFRLSRISLLTSCDRSS